VARQRILDLERVTAVFAQLARGAELTITPVAANPSTSS
jgi:hypothetical protein